MKNSSWMQKWKIRIMILFSLKNFVAYSMILVILNSTEFIPSSVRVSPSLRSFDAICYLKIDKYSLDVNFGLTSWLRDFKISSSSSSIFSSCVFPPLTLLFHLRFGPLLLLKCRWFNFCRCYRFTLRRKIFVRFSIRLGKV